MTRSHLLKMREDFWSTRVEGRPEMWQALKLAVEAEDSGTRLLVLEGAGLSPFRQDKPNMFYSYDQRGFKYELPMYVLYEPRNLMSEAELEAQQDAQTAANVPLTAEQLNKAKKAIKTKIKFSTGMPDQELQFTGQTTIAQIKLEIEKKFNINQAEQLFYFGGKQLKDTHSLYQVGYKSDYSLQCFVRKSSSAKKG